MIRTLRLAAAAALVAVAALAPAEASAQRTVTCSSRDYDRTVCNVDTRGGVELVRQLSSSPCVRGRSWGVARDGLWVSRGCRAQFHVGGRRDDRYGDRDRGRWDDRGDYRRDELSADRAATLCRREIRRVSDSRNRDIRLGNARRQRDGDVRLEWRARDREGTCTVDARTRRVSLRVDRNRC